MADSELLHTLDYILNRCDEKSIEALAAAIVRRRRELTMFGGVSALPNPGRMAKELSSQLNLEGVIDGLQENIRDYAIRIIRQEAPELTETQIEELARTWIPSPNRQRRTTTIHQNSQVPQDALYSMIDQFISFSLGRMEEEEDHALRKEMGSWPDKYWKSFPQAIRLLIANFLKGELEEKDFNTQIDLALQRH